MITIVPEIVYHLVLTRANREEGKWLGLSWLMTFVGGTNQIIIHA